MKFSLYFGALRRHTFLPAGFAAVAISVSAAPTVASKPTPRRGAVVTAVRRVPSLSLMSIEQSGSVISAARPADSGVEDRISLPSRRLNQNMTLPATFPLSTPIVRRDRVGNSANPISLPQRSVLNPKRGLASKSMAPNRKSNARRGGKQLASRSVSDRVLLARLEADLVGARRRLNNASVDLSQSERDLKRFTSTLNQAMLDAGPDARGLHPFVKVAQRYAGTPYVWGGESRNGFDCSGLIIIVMRELGYRALPHSAADQFTYGKPIAQALLKPGDLVFFANTYKPGISHVGIYLGRGRFIHAAGTGKGTIVSYLSDSPYRQKYAGARRLVARG